MPINYDFDDISHCVFTTLSGDITLNQVDCYVEAVSQDEAINRPFYEIVDFSRIERFDLGYEQSDTVISLLMALRSKKEYRGSCIVVDRDFTKGISNIFRVIAEEKGVDLKVFKAVDEASEYVSQKLKLIN